MLAAWSGLGYYRRARQLHRAARMIVSDHGGEFPASSESLRDLPGIGRYTSAAIASIVFDEPAAAVDGNVERVLRRLAGTYLPSHKVWAFAEQLVSRERPGDFNQAVMELGALVCVPRRPNCLDCPVMRLCATRGELNGTRKSVPQRKAILHYALSQRGSSVFLVQRAKDASLMPGMWELPETPKNGSNFKITLRHSITMTDYLVRVSEVPDVPSDISGKWLATSRLSGVALTGLARKILRAADII